MVNTNTLSLYSTVYFEITSATRPDEKGTTDSSRAMLVPGPVWKEAILAAGGFDGARTCVAGTGVNLG